MRAHLAYLKYVLSHKWHVFWACLKLGVPLHLAIWHDMSKFSPAEWSPYVHNFYYPDGTKKSVRDATGSYDPHKSGVAFKRAWLHHQRNKHHWQAWVSMSLDGEVDILPMPLVYILEMVADWIGANKANGGDGNPAKWWAANRSRMMLHKYTEETAEALVQEIDYEWRSNKC